jgi:hypothetical protein
MLPQCCLNAVIIKQPVKHQLQFKLLFLFIYSFIYCIVLGIECRALCMLGKHLTTELHPQAKFLFLDLPFSLILFWWY